MEDVLAVYTRPRDGDCPLVCLDETSKQLIAETRVPIPMKAGRPARFDYEYERNGTANLFMMFAPLEGWGQTRMCRFPASGSSWESLVPRQGHRSPYRGGLRSRLERLGRHPLRACQDHRSGPGQSQHPQQGFD
jgi:hypothetical protein